MTDRRQRNILIFRIGHLGDTLVSVPALWSLRSAFSTDRLTMLCGESDSAISPRAVLPEMGLIDDWITYPQQQGSFLSLLDRVRLWWQIRTRRFDEVYYLMPRLRSRQQIDRDERFFRSAGIQAIRCLNHFREHAIELPLRVPIRETFSESDFLLHCLASEGIEPRGRSDIALTQDERDAAARWLADRKPIKDGPFVAVGPGSKWSSKVWAAERFERTLSTLLHKRGAIPIIFGGKEDRTVGDTLISRIGTGMNAAGELSVRESAALLETCKLYIGNDTGTMHLAASAGVPCVGIFSAIDLPGRWVPFGERNVLFRRSVPCEGCHSPTCSNALACLEGISEKEVIGACLRVLSDQER